MVPSSLDNWLERVNSDLAVQGMPHRQRPFEALSRYSTEHGVSIDISSELATSIFTWFERRSPPGAHEVGSMFESVYYYDAAFWRLSIPVVFGTVSLNALDGLYEMPSTVRDGLERDARKSWDYVIYWADCVDYGLGMDDFRKGRVGNEFARELAFAADAELRAAVELLHVPRPQARALLTCRMAVELFLKAFCATKGRLDEKSAKTLSHDLDKAFDLFLKVSGFEHWRSIRQRLSIFPSFSARYQERAATPARLWEAFALAQSLGAVLIREVTDRNTLRQVFPDGLPK